MSSYEYSPLIGKSDDNDEDNSDWKRSADDDDEERGVKRVYTYDEAIEEIGLGRFHCILVLVCGWANATDAVEVMCVSLVLTSAGCEMDISSSDLGLLTAIIFVGMLIGGYFWGSLGDTVGRKTIMVTALIVNAVFGFLSAFATAYWTFVICRFLSGVGVGGSIPVIWSYFVEFQPVASRGMMLSFIATFWMIGQLVVAGIAWILLPRQYIMWHLGSFSLGPWRIFMILSTVVCATSAIFCSFLPESPKLLLEKGKKDEALRIIQKVYSTNKRVPLSACPIKQLEPPESCAVLPRRAGLGYFQKITNAFKSMYHQSIDLMKPPLLRFTLALIGINFTLSFGYYGLNLWFPELWTRMETTGGKICTHSLPQNHTPTVRNCSPEVVGNPVVFRDDFLVAIAQLPGNLITIFLLDRIGRKPIFIFGIIISAVSVFVIYVVSTSLEVLLLSMLFGGVSILCWNCLDAFATELFPTYLRATSMGLCLLFARLGAIIGNLIFGALIDQYCEIPLIIVAVLLALGGLISFSLPETTRRIIH